jgi:hypothetical protein
VGQSQRRPTAAHRRGVGNDRRRVEAARGVESMVAVSNFLNRVDCMWEREENKPPIRFFNLSVTPVYSLEPRMFIGFST